MSNQFWHIPNREETLKIGTFNFILAHSLAHSIDTFPTEEMTTFLAHSFGTFFGTLSKKVLQRRITNSPLYPPKAGGHVTHNVTSPKKR